jgi:hypothetical protein
MRIPRKIHAIPERKAFQHFAQYGNDKSTEQLQRQQVLPAQQALRGLWQRNDVAESLGEELGGREILQRGLPQTAFRLLNRLNCLNRPPPSILLDSLLLFI